MIQAHCCILSSHLKSYPCKFLVRAFFSAHTLLIIVSNVICYPHKTALWKLYIKYKKLTIYIFSKMISYPQKNSSLETLYWI